MRARALHRALKQIGGVRSDAKAFADVLPRAVQPLVDDLRYHGRVDRQTAHCRVEKVGLFFCQGADDVLDRDIILIATF